MKVFVTGASGWIGSAAVDELLGAGHDVVGLARSDASAASLEAKGVTVRRGDLDDLDALRRGAADADAVVHLANKHDFANPAESNRAERAAVETLADELVGSNRPFLLASGLLRPDHGGLALETDRNPFVGPDSMRGGSENLALDYVERGVRTVAIRFAPTVHGIGDHGFVAVLVAAARRTGVSGYLGDGSSAWGAVHRSDAARLVRLGLEQAPAGARLHAVAEERILSHDIADAIGRSLELPVAAIEPEAAIEHFGFIGGFFGTEMTASSAATRAAYDWTPTGPTLVEDILGGAYGSR